MIFRFRDFVRSTLVFSSTKLEDEKDEDADEDDGLTGKFRRSSFAEAIRATVADMASFIQ